MCTQHLMTLAAFTSGVRLHDTTELPPFAVTLTADTEALLPEVGTTVFQRALGLRQRGYQTESHVMSDTEFSPEARTRGSSGGSIGT